MLRSPRTRLTAIAAAAALAAASCGGDSGGLPDEPEAAVTQAFANRAEGGFSVGFAAALSEGARDRLARDMAGTADLASALEGEVLRVSTDGEGQVGVVVQFENEPAVEYRVVDEALYLRIDVDGLVERFAPEQGSGMDEIRGQIDQLAPMLGEELTPVLRAALDGSWVGITGVTQEQVEDFARQFGGAAPSDASEAASELGLLDLESFADRYLQVESGGDGEYQVALRVRELLEAAGQLAATTGQAMGAPSELTDAPEQVGGIVVTVEDEQVDTVELDLGVMAEDAGEESSELGPGDAVITATFDEPDDDLTEVPDDAVTAPWSAVERTLGQMLGMMGGLGSEPQGT